MNLSGFLYVNYIDEYLDKVLNFYSLYAPHFFITYYKFKHSESIIDDIENTKTASYHMADDLSGRKWDKIIMLPVWHSSGHGEINYRDVEFSLQREVELSFIMPDLVGIIPTAEDFVSFKQGVLIDSNDDPLEQPLFIVKGYDVSHVGKRRWYRINVKNYYVTTSQIETKINERFFYIHQLRSIYPVDVAYNILKIYNFLEDEISYEIMDNGIYSMIQTPLLGVE